MTSQLITGFLILAGIVVVLVAYSLITIASRGDRELEEFEAALLNPNAGTPESGYHPGSAAELNEK